MESFPDPFFKQPGQSEAHHWAVGSRNEPQDSTKRWPESECRQWGQRKHLHCRRQLPVCVRNENSCLALKKLFQLELLEKIWPESLKILVVQLPSNIIGCLSDQHIPACFPLNRCQGGTLEKKKHLLTAEEATRVPAVER